MVGVQESKGYGVGFGIPTIAFGVAIAMFVAGAAANLYVRVPPEGSPFSRIGKVLRGEGCRRISASLCVMFVAGAAANLYVRVPPEGSHFSHLGRVLRGELHGWCLVSVRDMQQQSG